MKHWEHHLTFPIEHQGTVSLWVTVVIQTFGTVYIAILVYLIQNLAMRRNFGSGQTLTAIHDVISAWAGLGSALISLWKQASVPASVFGTLNIVGYLCCISILHISIPAMISVEVFNTTLAIPASTLGIPEYVNGSAINSTRNYMNTFGTNVLPFRGLFDGPQMQGLLNGTLYEVLLNTTSAKGTAQVSATGFNISCGYVSAQISDVDLDPGDGGLWLIVDGLPGWLNGRDSSLFSNALSIYDAYGFGMTDNNNSIYLSTTAVVVDSQGNLGSPLIFAQQPPGIFRNLTNFNLSSSQIQFLKCSKSIVPQSATIDATSNIVLDGTLRPDIYKNHSTWISAAELDFAPKSSTLVGSGLWSETLCSDGGVISVYPTSNAAVNEYLMSYLGLDPFANATSVTLKLHNIENALASVLAMVFWGVGHVQVNPWYIKYSDSPDGQPEAGTVPELVAGTTIIMQEKASSVQLNLNIVAVTLGLATGIIQMFLCLIILCTLTEHDGSTVGSGLMHNIWNRLKSVFEPPDLYLFCSPPKAWAIGIFLTNPWKIGHL
ncbi:hypothetical protein MSAN_00098300 [Mycena sanguinolenta]|uniref:Uncharacterized protein n=1 Tax=Mycena sanguinolenta TaxID=230812 RepID=A0A8H7DIN6_9AGAR|nr:hypothetical protein MSAN_00098300 [Mycena sanguinolenta]